MKDPADSGTNRTGICTSPLQSRAQLQNLDPDLPMHDGHALEAERLAWSRGAYPVGTIPRRGQQPAVFIDKLGERLQYERTATRLYEALLAKLDAAPVHPDDPTYEELELIRDEEHRHYLWVRNAIRDLGADPTVVTPSADVTAVASMGWIQVLTDPRTTLAQALDVILLAELGDEEGWNFLAQLAEELGFDELSHRFRLALVEEDAHVMRLRDWVVSRVQRSP